VPLSCIKGIYHFRKQVPQNLRPIIKKPEIWQTLKTKDNVRATMLCERLTQQITDVEISLKLNLISFEEAELKLKECGLVSYSKKPELKNTKKRLISTKSDLSRLFNSFSKEKIESGKWTLKTQMEYQQSFRIFLQFYKESEQPAIDHGFLLSYRELLKSLPPSFTKKANLKNKKLLDIAAMDHEITLSARQINKYLICVNGFFGWLFQHEYIEKNPAHHLLLPKNKKLQEERKAYTVEEIELIIKEVVAFKDASPAKYWTPVISIYSGLRLNEICQLRVADIVYYDKVPCFDINDNSEDKSLKTASSARIIPVHPALVELGFIKYVEGLRAKNVVRVFPELTKQRIAGYGAMIGKWFSVFNRQYVTQDKKKTFHSIRHSVANELKQLQVPSEVTSELLGHKLHSITMNRYGKRYRPKVLLDAIKMLPW
jgi:integrase